MIEHLYADIGYRSLCKNGEFVCGDHIERLERPDGSIVLVLADGLGSGVKACILSTLTSTIISRMIAETYPEIRWLDREDDMGEEGLRQAKLSYNPAVILEKSLAVLKEEFR